MNLQHFKPALWTCLPVPEQQVQGPGFTLVPVNPSPKAEMYADLYQPQLLPGWQTSGLRKEKLADGWKKQPPCCVIFVSGCFCLWALTKEIDKLITLIPSASYAHICN